MIVERLRHLMNYSPDTGKFTRRIQCGKCAPNSVVTGTLSHGYLRASIDNKVYALHRLAFLWMTGKWPNADVDHIDGDRANNRWSNLRDVSRQVNMENLREARRNNLSTGLLGVHSHGIKFRSRIRAAGKVIELGSFETKEAAHAVYVSAKRRLHEGNTL